MILCFQGSAHGLLRKWVEIPALAWAAADTSNKDQGPTYTGFLVAVHEGLDGIYLYSTRTVNQESRMPRGQLRAFDNSGAQSRWQMVTHES